MEIDRKTLKALAADTRLDILKSLGKRRKTPSELSKELDLATSTVIEHLTKLEEANLVRREETGHKWIYYNLTPKGENLVKPRYPVQFVLVLSISILIIFAAGFMIYTDYTSLRAAQPSLTAPLTEKITQPSEESKIPTTGIAGGNITNITNVTNTTNNTSQP